MPESSKYSDLPARLKTAAILGVLILGSLFVHPYVFLFVITTFFFFISIEFINIRGRYYKGSDITFIQTLKWGWWSMWPFFISFYFFYRGDYPPFLPGVFLSISLIFSVISLMDLFRCSFNRIFQMPKWLISFGYFGSHMALWPLVLFYLGSDWWIWVLFFLFVIWVNDTFAFFSGKLFGKRKLYPSVSPNKTVEGLIGGVVGSLLLGWIFAPSLKVELMHAITAAAITGLGVSLGDLVQSRYKRMAGVKDSGVRLPGHGGFYDRFDGLFFIMPYMVMLVIFFQQYQ